MRSLWGRYARWTLRRASTAQCSPALIVACCVLAAGAVIYVYREVILHTVELALLTALTIVFLVVAVRLAFTTARWYRDRQVPVAQYQAEPVPATMGDTRAISAEADAMAAKAIGAEASWLGADEVDLAVDEHGKLKVRDSRS